MSKLIQEKEMYRRKLARARRISRIQRRRSIDRYIKGRVYVIIVFLVFVIGILILIADNQHEVVESQGKGIRLANTLLDELSQDKLVVMNSKLVRVVDSLQIIVFVYHRRHMKDQEDILNLITKLKRKGREYKHKENKLEIPDYFKKDSLALSFLDTTPRDTIEIIDTIPSDSIIVDTTYINLNDTI